MSGEVVVALITLLGSAIGTIGGIFATNKMAFFIPKENVPNYEEVRAFMLSKMRPKQARMDDLYGTLAEE